MTAFTPPERFNMASYFLESNLDAGRGDKRALVVKDRSGEVSEHTYADVVRLQNRAASAFVDLGLELEQRVLIAAADGPAFVASWFGGLKAGATVAAVNPLLPAADYGYYLEYTRARVAVCDPDSLPGFLEVLPAARHLRALVVSETPSAELPPPPQGAKAALVSFEDITSARDDDFPAADTHRDDVAVWLFTSGTTGKPKAAMHFHQDFVYNAERYAKRVLQLGPDDRTMAVPKLFFGYATGSNLMFPFAAGAEVVLFQEKSKPEAVLQNAHRFRPTVLVNVPTTINGMLAVEGATERYDLSSLRYMTSAGEALPPELYRRWMDAFGCEILDGIGSAEMFHVFISNRLGDVRPGSLGKLVDGYSARIVGPDGQDVEPGQIGRLWIHGESAALGYFQDRARSRATFHGDYCITADLFRQDEEGYFYFAGRGDDMLKVGGIWVSPLEIEGCLLEHPAVRECAVIGVPEDDLIKPKAFVVLAEGYAPGDDLAEELKLHVKNTLARYKYPRQIEFIAALPRNDRGKVEKRRLREREGIR